MLWMGVMKMDVWLYLYVFCAGQPRSVFLVVYNDYITYALYSYIKQYHLPNSGFLDIVR